MSGIVVSGFEDMIDGLTDMTLTDADEKKIMKAAMEPAKQEIENNTPVRSGETKKAIKETVKKQDFATVGEIKMNKWYTQFEEYGTSKQKDHIGFFSRAVENTKDEVVHRIADDCFEKGK